MRRQVIASTAALALFAAVDGTGLAVAQEATGGASGTSQTGNPPATTTQTPTPQSPSSSTQAPPTSQTTTTPGAAGTALPEVQVIQEQPKPQSKQIKQAAKPNVQVP